jgi:hypothetical protein
VYNAITDRCEYPGSSRLPPLSFCSTSQATSCASGRCAPLGLGPGPDALGVCINPTCDLSDCLAPSLGVCLVMKQLGAAFDPRYRAPASDTPWAAGYPVRSCVQFPAPACDGAEGLHCRCLVPAMGTRSCARGLACVPWSRGFSVSEGVCMSRVELGGRCASPWDYPPRQLHMSVPEFPGEAVAAACVGQVCTAEGLCTRCCQEDVDCAGMPAGHGSNGSALAWTCRLAPAEGSSWSTELHQESILRDCIRDGSSLRVCVPESV